MSFTLHAAIVPAYRQMLGTVATLIDKAEDHCTAAGLDPAQLIDARLAADMLPFAYQVKSTAVHSIGAIEGVRRGEFNPDRSPPPDSFAGLRDRIEAARGAIAAIDPGEIDGLVGRDVLFVAGSMRIPFTAEDFLLSFSQPNFYFHVNATYAILRAQGVTIGKLDYLGTLRTKA